MRADIRDYAIPDLYLAASRESKTKLLTGFKAAPFVEPATGLAYFRARWYDPATGTFLTPDPMGYQDSSNLYAAFGNDPVNASDPRGEELTYAAWVGVNTLFDTSIDLAIHSWADVYHSRDTKFDWGESFTTNLAVNAITGGVGGKLKYFKYLKNPVARFLATEGAEYAFDVAATGTVDVVLNHQSPGEAYGSAALGGLLGRGVAHGGSGLFHGGGGYLQRSGIFDMGWGSRTASQRGSWVIWPDKAGVQPRHFTESAEGRRLFQASTDYRNRFPGSGRAKAYRNFVAADVTIDGNTRMAFFKNTPGGLHSEERLITWVARMEERGHRVSVDRVFTDRIPCGPTRANCSGKLTDAFGPGLEVYYNILKGKL